MQEPVLNQSSLLMVPLSCELPSAGLHDSCQIYAMDILPLLRPAAGLPERDRCVLVEGSCTQCWRILLDAFDASAGLLHILVDGKHVLPGGHKLALDVPEHCQLAFMVPDAHCRAGEPHGALVQLLDGKGFQLQVSLRRLTNPTSSAHALRAAWSRSGKLRMLSPCLVGPESRPSLLWRRGEELQCQEHGTGYIEKHTDWSVQSAADEPCPEMQAGGAAVSASITAQGMQESAKVAVLVRDRGTGLYELQFSLVQVTAVASRT